MQITFLKFAVIITILGLGLAALIFGPTDNENQKVIRARINLDLTNVRLRQFIHEHGKWPPTAVEMGMPVHEIRGLLEDGTIKCFIPLDRKSSSPIVITMIDKEEATYAVLTNEGYSEKRMDREHPEFEGYRLLLPSTQR